MFKQAETEMGPEYPLFFMCLPQEKRLTGSYLIIDKMMLLNQHVIHHVSRLTFRELA